MKGTFFWKACLVLVTTLGVFGLGQVTRAAPPPNVVLIVADDLGWADLGVYGSRYHQTPNLDRLAAEGLRFTDAYASAPVCSPTRASLMTGQHPARLGLTDWLPGRPDRPDQRMARPALPEGLPLPTVTLAEVMRAAGYATGHVGKWHLGGERFEPQRQGFDLNVGGDHAGTPRSYFAPYRGRDGRFIPGLEDAPAGEYVTDRLTAEAERFIEAHAEKPFFLHLAHFAPHIPMKAKQPLIEKHRARIAPDLPQRNPVYAAMLESLDESVGRVLATLDRLNLTARTLVIFTSDNGGLSVPEGPDTPATSNAPLRAGKGFLYEGGLRVPLIVRWPGHVRPGGVSALPVSSVDLPPTILALTGARGRLSATDGKSLAPLILGRPGGAPPRSLFWHYPHYSNQGGRPGGAVREGSLKLIERFEDGGLELYDLAADPGEANDLAAARPATARRLHRLLRGWRTQIGARAMRPHPGYTGEAQGQALNGSGAAVIKRADGPSPSKLPPERPAH